MPQIFGAYDEYTLHAIQRAARLVFRHPPNFNRRLGAVKVKKFQPRVSTASPKSRLRMARENFEKFVLNVRLDRKQTALQEALLVPWRELEASVNEYVQWHSFILWVRTISEIAGELPDAVRLELQELCPGFLDGWEVSQNHGVWYSLEEWITAQHFGEAKAEGWFDALMYYAYQDLRVEQGWTLRERTKTAWRETTPSRWPTLQEWKAEIVATQRLAQEGTEKARAVAAMGKVDGDRLRTAISDVLERRALVFWIDCVSRSQHALDATILSEVEKRCPTLLAGLSRESVWRASVFSRLLRHGESEWRAVARAEGWYAAFRYHVAHHPRYQRLIHYRQRCHDEWLNVPPISLPSFPAWLSAADAYCVNRAA